MMLKINLLPEIKKGELKRKKLFKLFLKQEFFLLFCALVFWGVIMSLNFILDLEISSGYAVQIEKISNSKENKQMEQKIIEINGKADVIKGIEEKHLQWTKLFSRINSYASQDITLEGMNNTDFRVFLSGKASNRERLLEFQEKISQDQCFENLNTPLSNFVQKDNPAFKIDFAIKKDCITGHE